MHFNPTDIQTIGIGLAAFVTTVSAIFIFLGVGRERVGRTMGMSILAAAVWSWFGFLYEIVPGLALARDLRVVSMMGIVWLTMAHVNFSVTYLRERRPLGRWSRWAEIIEIAIGTLLTLILVGDLFGGRLIVGDLLASPDLVLAPNAGPLLAPLIVYYVMSIALTAIVLALRARAGVDKPDRRQAEVIFVSLAVGLVLGGTRFTPWYGFNFLPIVGALAAPFFLTAMFYSIKRYNLFNVQVIAAQLLIFVLWSFTFFRLLLDPTVEAAVPDIGLFIAVLILGVYLLRSIIKEIRTQKELAQLTIERVKSEFVTVAAHQLRTPLTAVRWTFEILSEKEFTSALSPEQRRSVELGRAAADNMTLIVNDLLNVARISGGVLKLQMESGDVRDAVRAAGHLFEDAARTKDITLMFELPPDPLKADFDRGKLALATENLLDNAIKYTPNGGTVVVRATREGNKVLVSVTDSGIGISRGDQEQLFEKFFRGKNAMKMFTDGSGLGLFITKNIIEGHGGTVALTASAGGGTVATITLPSIR